MDETIPFNVFVYRMKNGGTAIDSRVFDYLSAWLTGDEVRALCFSLSAQRVMAFDELMRTHA